MASSIASTSNVGSSSHHSKHSSSKEHKDRSGKEHSRSHRSSSKDRHKKKSRRESNSGSKEDDEHHTKDGWKGKKVSGPKESAFRYLYPIIDVSIPPALMNNPHRAAEELLDTLLMRYVPQMSGVLLSHHNISFLRSHAKIDSDGAYSIAPAGFTCLVWAPEIGMRLEGQIQLSTPSHISLLVHGIFNASITSVHLPANFHSSNSSKDSIYKWQEFKEGEMEGEVGVTADVKMEDEADEALQSESMSADLGEKSTGYWENKETGERLGGKDGKVVFTVVGMTVANHMLSIFGSLLRKPFSIPAPTYVPKPSTSLSASIDNARRVHFQEGHQSRTLSVPNGEEDDNDDGEENSDVDEPIAASNIVAGPETIQEDPAKKKKRSKVGPRREGETSGSESETDAKREKKKRRKE